MMIEKYKTRDKYSFSFHEHYSAIPATRWLLALNHNEADVSHSRNFHLFF